MKLALGRNFSQQEDQRGGAPVVIVSNRFWRNRLSGSTQAVGKPVALNGIDYTIVGVLPPGFRFGDDEVDVYTPLGQGDPLMLDPRGAPGDPVHRAAETRREHRSGASGDERDPGPSASSSIPTRIVAWEPTVVPLKQVMIGDVSGTLSVAVGSRGAGFADRLRERRQSPAGALSGTHARVCHSLGARREPRARGAAVADRKHASFRSPAAGSGTGHCKMGHQLRCWRRCREACRAAKTLV